MDLLLEDKEVFLYDYKELKIIDTDDLKNNVSYIIKTLLELLNRYGTLRIIVYKKNKVF